MPTENKTIGQQRLDRIIAANEFIQVVANCGRFFFRNKGAGHDAYLTLNARRNIVWLFDDYTGARINVAKEGEWDGFSHGGTLKSLVGSIGAFVLSGKTMRYGYFQPTMDNCFESRTSSRRRYDRPAPNSQDQRRPHAAAGSANGLRPMQ